MKKLFLILTFLGVAAGGFYFYSNLRPDLSYKGAISYRLKDALGYDVKIGEVIVYDESDVIDIENIEFLHPLTGKPFLKLETLKGVYDPKILLEKKVLYFKNLELSGISLPGLEENVTIDPAKQDVNFRDLFVDWDHEENITKAQESIRTFYEKSHSSAMKKTEALIQKIDAIETFAKQSTKGNAPQLEKNLKEIEMGLLSYQSAVTKPAPEKLESFIQSKYELVRKGGFFEKDFFEFLFDENIKKDGKSISSVMRTLYRAQFFSAKADEGHPHLVIDNISILEKQRADDKNALVGFIKNLSSRHDDERHKMEILLQGDFVKYGIMGLDIRMGVFKDDNKIITFTGRVEEFPIQKRILFEDEKRVIFNLPGKGRFAFKGTVHKSEVRADFSYETPNLKFYHSPVHDKVISHVLTKYESNEKNRINLIIDDKPDNKGFIAVEYGDQYLDAQPSKELFDAYVEDVLDSYFRTMDVHTEAMKTEIKSLEEKIKRAEEVKKLIEEKLKG